MYTVQITLWLYKSYVVRVRVLIFLHHTHSVAGKYLKKWLVSFCRPNIYLIIISNTSKWFVIKKKK